MHRFLRPLPGWLAMSVGMVAGAGFALSENPTGRVIATQSRPYKVELGPEPDVAFFATGEAVGKIEPCG
jgi:hypothetical protein